VCTVLFVPYTVDIKTVEKGGGGTSGSSDTKAPTAMIIPSSLSSSPAVSTEVPKISRENNNNNRNIFVSLSNP
jgi:hypothetical protein